MLKTKQTAAFILLVTVILATIPNLTTTSAILRNSAKKVENYVALVDKAKEHVQNLINLTYANETALKKIDEAGLTDELEGNKTLFNHGVGNLTAAHFALGVEDYEGAIANATNAFKIFKQVFVALYVILSKSGVPKGRLVDAQGLIEAMERALERIEKLEEMNLPDEAQKILNNAKIYLNIDTARIWLQEGRVNDVVWNLTKANRLIAEAHMLIMRHARNMVTVRMRNFLKGLNQTCERIIGRLHSAEDRGFNVTDMLGNMGYGNMEQLQQNLRNMIEEAEQRINEIQNVMQNLNRISETIRQIDHDLARQGNNRKP